MAENVKCKSCKRLKNHWRKAVLDSPDEDMLRDCRHFLQKTNADRIRAMNDEELAHWICKMMPSCSSEICPGAELCNATDGLSNGLVKWLQQPAEVDNG